MAICCENSPEGHKGAEASSARCRIRRSKEPPRAETGAPNCRRNRNGPAALLVHFHRDWGTTAPVISASLAKRVQAKGNDRAVESVPTRGLEDVGSRGHIAVLSQSPTKNPDEPVGIGFGGTERLTVSTVPERKISPRKKDAARPSQQLPTRRSRPRTSSVLTRARHGTDWPANPCPVASGPYATWQHCNGMKRSALAEGMVRRSIRAARTCNPGRSIQCFAASRRPPAATGRQRGCPGRPRAARASDCPAKGQTDFVLVPVNQGQPRRPRARTTGLAQYLVHRLAGHGPDGYHRPHLSSPLPLKLSPLALSQ